jgi:hypothetical protein
MISPARDDPVVDSFGVLVLGSPAANGTRCLRVGRARGDAATGARIAGYLGEGLPVDRALFKVARWWAISMDAGVDKESAQGNTNVIKEMNAWPST